MFFWGGEVDQNPWLANGVDGQFSLDKIFTCFRSISVSAREKIRKGYCQSKPNYTFSSCCLTHYNICKFLLYPVFWTISLCIIQILLMFSPQIFNGKSIFFLSNKIFSLNIFHSSKAEMDQPQVITTDEVLSLYSNYNIKKTHEIFTYSEKKNIMYI